MAQNNRKEVKVRPVRKNKPDVRALARVLIELAMADSTPEVVKAVDVVDTDRERST